MKQSFKDFRLLLRAWPYIGPHRFLFFVCLLLLFGMGFLQFLEPIILKEAVDQGLESLDLLFWYSSLFFLVITVEAVFRMLELNITYSLVGQMIFYLRQALVEKMVFLSASFHERHPSGVLVSRATNDFDSLTESLNEGLMESIVDILTLLSCVLGIFYLDWHLGVITLCVLPFLWMLMVFFSKAIKRSLTAAKKSLAVLHGFAQECLSGIDTIKTLSGEKDGSKKFFFYSEEFRKHQTDYLIYDAVFYSVIEGFAAIFMGFTFFYIGKNVFDMTWSGGMIIGLLRYVQKLFDPIKKIGFTLSLLQGAFTSLERIFEILDQKTPSLGDKKPSFEHFELEATKLSFSYDGQKNAFENLSFSLKKGQSLAIVGPTGSGKTTLVSLLTKVYSGYEGSLKINGVEIKDIESEYLRNHIGVVSQNVSLFPGTLRFNISLGRPSVTESSLNRAVDLVGARDFISSLPSGLDFMVLDHGTNLSLGEKQLILFARALAINPSFVILDEASSALDEETEDMVQKAMKEVFRTLPVLIIAHRKKTIQMSDHVLSMQQRAEPSTSN